MNLKPALFEVDEVTVRSIRNDAELAEITPSGMLSFSGNDLFSQIWILPGVTGTPTGNNFMVVFVLQTRSLHVSEYISLRTTL